MRVFDRTIGTLHDYWLHDWSGGSIAEFGPKRGDHVGMRTLCMKFSILEQKLSSLCLLLCGAEFLTEVESYALGVCLGV